MTVFVDSSTLRPGRRPEMPPDEPREWLAGKKGEPVQTATAHTSRGVNEVIRLLEQSRMKTHFSPSEHFNRTLRLWEAASRRAEMDEWLDLCGGMERALTPLADALALLAQHAWSSYEDLLGLTYMTLGLGDVRKGQYFTPFAVARMMAEMILDDWQPPYGPAGPPACFYEPACGSGVMFLGVMAVLEERFPNSFPVLLRQGLILFRGIDLDPTAVLMATLNLRLRGYPFAAQTLTVGDALAEGRPEAPSPGPAPDLSLAPPLLAVEASEDDPTIPADPDGQSVQYLFF